MIDQEYQSPLTITEDTRDVHIIAIDPGREKTGMAVLTTEGALVQRCIIPTPQVQEALTAWCKEFEPVAHIVCGNGTNHKHLYPLIQEVGRVMDITTSLINESYSTEEARTLYWQWNGKRGWRKLVPQSMLFPPEPIDDITAYVIGSRYVRKEYGKEKNYDR